MSRLYKKLQQEEVHATFEFHEYDSGLIVANDIELWIDWSDIDTAIIQLTECLNNETFNN
jgi:hypothetical protein